MFVRLALEEDTADIVRMSSINMHETRPDLIFNPDRVRATVQSYLDEAAPTIFVVEHERKAIAFLVASMMLYRGADGLFTVQEVLFVRPEHRGTRAAVLLMKHLIAWSQQLGAIEIVGGNDNDFKSERTAKFLEHFGFVRVGYAMKRVIEHGR